MRETSVSSRVLEYLNRYLDEPNSCRELRATAEELHALLVAGGVLSSGDANAVSALLSVMARRQFIRTDGRAVAGSGRTATVYVLGRVALDYRARRSSSPGGTGGHARLRVAGDKVTGEVSQVALDLPAPTYPATAPRASQAPASAAQVASEPPVPPPPADPVLETLRELREARRLLQGAADDIVERVQASLGRHALRSVPDAELMAEVQRRLTRGS